MKRRIALLTALAAGTCAQAQPLMQVSYSWIEVIGGTTTPVASPNGVIDPGEGALITLDVCATIDGTDARGQSIYVPWGNPPHLAIVRGVGGFTYDLIGTGGDATGTWSNRRSPSLFTQTGPGVIRNNGARLDAVGAVQFLFPGSTADATNPVSAAWRGVWTPSDFTPRTIHFAFSASTNVPQGQQNTFISQEGFGYSDPSDPSTAYPLYWHIYVPSNFGSGMDIPIGTNFRSQSGGTSGGPHGFTATASCYVNCDHSSTPPLLNANDFQCFLNSFAAGLVYANCDNSTAQPMLNANDFQCFLNKFAAGCG